MKRLTKNQQLLQLQTKRLLLFGVAVVLICLAVWYGLVRAAAPDQPERLVTFYDRGMERSIITTAQTVQAALAAAMIEVDPHDIVDPAVSQRLTETQEDIIIYRSRPVVIEDGAIRQTVMTTSQSANSILASAGLEELGRKDTTKLLRGDVFDDGGRTKLIVTRAKVEAKVAKQPVEYVPKPGALTRSKGAHVYVDGDGVAHRETYYDLPMNIVIKACGPEGSYSIRDVDGAKVDQDGYILVAAGLAAYPRCTVVDTSMGPGKVYDTGGFALRHPYGFDLATDWTNFDGR